MQIAYMDDAGDLGIVANPPQHNDQPIFSLTILIANQARLSSLVPEFLQIKRNYFPGLIPPSSHFLAAVLKEIKGLAPPQKGRSAEAVLALGERAETTEVIRLVPTPVDYWISTTFQRERMYRHYFLCRDPGRGLFESYRELARLFPKGLAELPELPEEASGAVKSLWRDRRKARQ